jgi:hypothetical protein
LGTELGISVGPLGRTAGSDLRAGKGGVAAAFAYAHSRGLFVGVSIEAGVVINRPDVNEAFYGVHHKTRDILNGTVPQPKAADILYKALHEVESQPAPWELMQARMRYQPRRLGRGSSGGGGGGGGMGTPSFRSGEPVPSLRSQYAPDGYVPASIANPMSPQVNNYNTNYINGAVPSNVQNVAPEVGNVGSSSSGGGGEEEVPDEFADDFGPPDLPGSPRQDDGGMTTIVLTPEEQQLMDDAALAAALQDEEVQAYEENARLQQSSQYAMPGAGNPANRPRPNNNSQPRSHHPAVARAEAARRQAQQQRQQQEQVLAQQQAQQPARGVHPALVRHGMVPGNQAGGRGSGGPVHPAVLRAQANNYAQQYQSSQQMPVHPAILRNGGQQAMDPRRAR